jgi:NAD(P)-dependent dehydrogenase (short-subunit alcohol dehydrogenase family)
VKSVEATLDPDRALSVACDVTDRAMLDSVVDHALRKFGRIDVVFANAGIAADPPATIATIDEEVFERVLEVDLQGVWRTVRAALPQVLEHQGHVLVNASIYAFCNGMANAAYAMAKAGVEQFGRALRTELAHHGATAGVLYPGWVSTPITNAAFGGHPVATELVETAFPRPLRQRIGPEEVAAAVVEGIESRSRSIILPGRWTPMSVLRGLVNPLIDQHLERASKFHALLGQLEASTTKRP